MKTALNFVVLLSLALGAVCAAEMNEAVVAKVAVKEDGALFFNGTKVAISDLGRLLAPIKEKGGVVWYYRANPDGEPPPNAMDVLKVIMAQRLPTKLFVKEDFSEFVGADGKPHQEKHG